MLTGFESQVSLKVPELIVMDKWMRAPPIRKGSSPFAYKKGILLINSEEKLNVVD